jgi:curli biogenesis system outer membrane secretion channel CsgG
MRPVSIAAVSLVLLAFAASAHAGDPTSDAASLEQQLSSLPHRSLDERVPVTIYTFRCALANVDPDAATDMFMTALLKSGQFRVVERAQLQPDLAVEHTLNSSGQSTGDAAQHKLTGAKYIFEGAVSALGQQTDSQNGGVSVDGMTVAGGGSQGKVTVDVRIVDAGTGDVLDAISYTESLGTRHSSVQGVGNIIGSLTHGSLGAFTPDASGQTAHTDDYSDALRAAMEGSILALVKDIE